MATPPSDIVLLEDDINEYVIIKYPYICFIVVAMYIWFVKYYGPKMMSKKKPYQLTNVLKMYNVVQVLLNGYIVGKVLFTPRLIGDYWRHHCHYFNTADNPTYMEIVNLVYFCLLVKHVDLLDSVFMVMKKKYEQLSFLHVYHHAVVIAAFSVCLSDREGLGIIVLLINSLVHVIMYFYYFLTGFNALRKSLSKWKPFITKIQIVQFVIMLAMFIIFYSRGCSMGLRIKVIWVILVCSFLYLFTKFYIQTYWKKRKAK